MHELDIFEELSTRVKKIPVSSIRASLNNPRGSVEKDASFQRLVASIDRVGVLVPIVVRELGRPTNDIRYELVDGERRFLAAQELRRPTIPAHVLETDASQAKLRKLMFHLHMTREQWDPLAQCKALSEMYDDLNRGIPFDQKSEWVKTISRETGMSTMTARDRVHVLAWAKSLKERILKFDMEQPHRDIYSYVLAIEASIVDPSVTAFPNFYNHGRPVERTANHVRGSLLDKTIDGIETGIVRSREQIRNVGPLFVAELEGSQKKAALTIFEHLVERKNYYYDDAVAEIEIKLPEILREKPPKPRKLIALVKQLTQTLESYEAEYIEASTKSVSKQGQISTELVEALEHLLKAARGLKSRIA